MEEIYNINGQVVGYYDESDECYAGCTPDYVVCDVNYNTVIADLDEGGLNHLVSQIETYGISFEEAVEEAQEYQWDLSGLKS